MRRATLGTHLTPPPSRVSSKGFSNPRRARSAARGEIHQVLPNTSSRESQRDYENRISQRAYVERTVAKGRKRKAIFAGILAAVILAVACVVAAFVYTGGIDGRMKISDEALSAALAGSADEGNAAYTLLAASYDDGAEGVSPDELILVRTDPDKGRAALIAIPGNTSARLSDGEVHRIGEAYAMGGDAEVVSAVEGVANVQISHYVKADAAAFEHLIDALGGIEVNLPENITDPDAGSMTLSAGQQTLSGSQALFACRANDYYSAEEETRGRVVGLVAQGIFQKVSAMGRFDFYGNMDALSKYVKTDMGVMAAFDFLATLKNIAPGYIDVAALPTYVSEVDGVKYQVPIEDEVAAMLDRVRAGETPQVDKQDVVGSVDAASYGLTVNNGGGIEGAASEVAAMLGEAGFSVESIGNAEQQVFSETLVIYADSKNETAAQAVVATLGIGRAVHNSVHYSFDTDLLIMVGEDWQTVLDARESKASNGSSSSTDEGAASSAG